MSAELKLSAARAEILHNSGGWRRVYRFVASTFQSLNIRNTTAFNSHAYRCMRKTGGVNYVLKSK